MFWAGLTRGRRTALEEKVAHAALLGVLRDLFRGILCAGAGREVVGVRLGG